TVDMFACNTPANRTPHTVISPFSQLLASIILPPFFVLFIKNYTKMPILTTLTNNSGHRFY
ncbi:hypothetical protein, partial [Nitrosomonas nitrosa]